MGLGVPALLAIGFGKIKPGDLDCLVAFGAGLTWGSVFPALLAIGLGKIKPGDLDCLVAFGAGLTWGSVFLRY